MAITLSNPVQPLTHNAICGLINNFEEGHKVGIDVKSNGIKRKGGFYSMIWSVANKTWCFKLIWSFYECENMMISPNVALGHAHKASHGPIGEWR